MSMLLITNKKEGWCFYSDISIPFSMEILLFSSDLSLFETNRDLEISLAIKNKKIRILNTKFKTQHTAELYWTQISMIIFDNVVNHSPLNTILGERDNIYF